jgi:hypothetical protein
MDPMDQEIQESTSHRKHHPVKVTIHQIQMFGNQLARIRVKWLVAGIIIFVLTVILTQIQFNQLNQAEREDIRTENIQRDYLNRLAAHNLEVVQYNSCILSVQTAIGNRAWKVWLLNKLETSLPGSQVATDIVIEGREQLDALIPSREIAECRDPGPILSPPPEFGDLGPENLPPITPPITTIA